jgi:hypothetical protein
MKRTLPLALVAASLAVLPATASAAPKPQAEVLGAIVVDGDTATLRARYVCEASDHLWISAKQTADGRKDPALLQEGSSGAATNWMDSNVWGEFGPVSDPGAFRCDGRSHTGTFTIATASAPWGSWGALETGKAWVQFCLAEMTEEGEEGEAVTGARWVQVR